MPGFFKAAAIVMSSGATIGTGVLMVLPEDSRVAELPALSCQQQFWLNADRTCQTWTVPHRDVERLLWAKADAIESIATTQYMTTAEPIPAKTADVARPRTRHTSDDQPKAARRIPATSAAAEGNRRTMTPPTSRQDFPG
jgi:hypothetical protein